MIKINEREDHLDLVDLERLKTNLLRRFRRYFDYTLSPGDFLWFSVPYREYDSWAIRILLNSRSIYEICFMSLSYSSVDDISLIDNFFKRFAHKHNLKYSVQSERLYARLIGVTTDESLITRTMKEFIIEAEKLNLKLRGKPSTGRKRL